MKISLSALFITLCTSIVIINHCLFATGRFKNTRPQLPPLEQNRQNNTAIEESEIIKITLENKLPEGASIRSYYTTHNKHDPFMQEAPFTVPGRYHIKLLLNFLPKSTGFLYTLEKVEFIDTDAKKILLIKTADELINDQTQAAEKNKPFVIELVRSNRQKLPPLSQSSKKIKLKKSKNQLPTIKEEDGEEEISSASTSATITPANSSTSLSSITEESELETQPTTQAVQHYPRLSPTQYETFHYLNRPMGNHAPRKKEPLPPLTQQLAEMHS